MYTYILPGTVYVHIHYCMSDTYIYLIPPGTYGQDCTAHSSYSLGIEDIWLANISLHLPAESTKSLAHSRGLHCTLQL